MESPVDRIHRAAKKVANGTYKFKHTNSPNKVQTAEIDRHD
jgi:hypothetical protein